ncbi:MAG TPA: beta-1,6-N-acetylglucosaminyltransferase, partial [Puia sp.]|nr:beta-1,6-N-acetylglucosaminyltransferase [Puia sp.]
QMKIAHLILTHKNPAQLERLLTSLDHPNFDFYIHLDRKTPIQPFEYLASRPNTTLLQNRAAVYWADFGTIQATLNGFHEIPIDKYDYINVISGQDFPLKTADYIHTYIAQRKGSEFITCESIEGPWKQAARRVQTYSLINWRFPGRFRLEKLINFILPTPRKFPIPDHRIVGRANWFTLTPDAIRYSLGYLDQHPELIRFYKLVWGADEFIFSTILYNSPFRAKIVDNLVYVDWPENHHGHPSILQAGHLPALQATDKLFGRKFDMNIDSTIFQLLEDWLAADSRPPA